MATRGSALARRQARSVASTLERRRWSVELVEVETDGDRVRDELIHRLGRTGAFVRALDERVLDGTVDAAVHSLKDVPTEMPDGLVIAGVPERAPAGDRLLCPDGSGIEGLPAGAIVGTASLRRRAQLLAERDDLEVRPIRGNVDTRIEKLLGPSLRDELERRRAAVAARAARTGNEDDQEPGRDDPGDGDRDGDGSERNGEDERDGEEEAEPTGDPVERWLASLAPIERRALERETDDEYDAIVLAAAGLERAGLAERVPATDLPTARFVPAPGQGALAITMRDGDRAEAVNRALDHPRTRVEVTAERAVLRRLGGGCVAPIGVHAVVQGEFVHVRARVLDRTGMEEVEGTRDLPVDGYLAAAVDFADELAARGAAELIERATGDAGRVDPETGSGSVSGSESGSKQKADVGNGENGDGDAEMEDADR